jgi:hypothetical protein
LFFSSSGSWPHRPPRPRLARTALTLQQAGLRIKALPDYLAQLLPWIYLNHPGREEGLTLSGSVRAALGEARLVFRGWEWAYTLRSLDALLAPSRRLTELQGLVTRLLSSSARRPLGCSGWQPGVGFGAVDARLLCREAWFCLQTGGGSGQAS